LRYETAKKIDLNTRETKEYETLKKNTFNDIEGQLQ